MLNKTIKRFLLIFLLALLSFFNCSGKLERSFFHFFNSYNQNENKTFRKTKTGRPLVWNLNSFPIEIMIEDDFSDSELSSIYLAINKWNEVLGRTVFVYRKDFSFGRYGTILLKKKNIRINPKMSNTLAVCRTYFLKLLGIDISIKHADIIFWTGLEQKNYYYVAVHELGHALGLVHDNTKVSIMHPYPLSSKKIILKEDVEALKKVYKLN